MTLVLTDMTTLVLTAAHLTRRDHKDIADAGPGLWESTLRGVGYTRFLGTGKGQVRKQISRV